MKRNLLIIMLLCIMLPTIGHAQKKSKKAVPASPEAQANPLLRAFDTPFGVPPFDKIDNEHYLPAFEVAIRQHKSEIEAIVSNPAKPDFNNTILAFDRAGRQLGQVNAIFGGLRGAHTNARLQEIARSVTPMLTAHYNDIRFNQQLFERIKAVYENRANLGLDLEQMRLVEKIYDDFARNGAALPEDQREVLKKLNQQMSMLSLRLGENLLAENNAFKLVIEDEADLAGLPEDVRSAAAAEAKQQGMEGKWVFTLAKPSWIPFLQFSEKRDLREKIYMAYVNRGDNNNEHDNKAPFIELMQLRKQMARMLGYDNYAEYFISDQMAQTPGNVYEFLYKIWEPSLERAKAERDEMQEIIRREGGDFTLASWDWWYYAEKVRKEKYDLNEDELRPYFPIEKVKQGNFLLAEKLFGLKFVKRTDLPVYHPEVEAYEVLNRDGSHQGVLYIDPHPRPSKRSGAWCGTYRNASWDEQGNRISPVVTIVMNFTRPVGDQPALLSFEEVRTYFHEFGHALHNLFAEGKYNRTSRSVPRDFVELPSQILENWAANPEFIKMYAFHYQTGEPMPDYLIDKLINASAFNQGFANTEYVAAAILDMDWHTMDVDENTDVNAFEKASMDRIGLIEQIYPRYRTTNFGHIHSTGYAAGYYVYRWAGVLDADAFMAFKESGDLFNKDLAERFRKYILAENGKWEGMDAYVRFRGQEPSIEHFLKLSGLK
ncbi:MAG: M3 family metallopeptidase [Bacteroidetes bacterium]|nr:M3 family metallopeptidase [Bacteroidota bacterium]